LKGFYDAQRLRQQLDTMESTMLALGVHMDEVLAVDVKAAHGISRRLGWRRMSSSDTMNCGLPEGASRG
jgi:hypothetical protein